MKIEKPLTKEEAKQGDLIPPGIYLFEVMDATDEISKSGSGAEMIKLKLKVFLDDGREKFLFDYLLEALEFKMAHFFEAVGLWDEYQEGAVEGWHCVARTGKLKIYTQKDKTGQYGDKSAVADYIVDSNVGEVPKAPKAQKAQKAAGQDFADDDIPF